MRHFHQDGIFSYTFVPTDLPEDPIYSKNSDFVWCFISNWLWEIVPS